MRFEENSNVGFDTEILAQGMTNNLFFREVPSATRKFPEASSINLHRSIKYGFGVPGMLSRYRLHRRGIAKSISSSRNRKPSTMEAC